MSKRKPASTPAPPPSVLNGTSGNDTLLWSRGTGGTIDGMGGFDTLDLALSFATADVIMSGAIAAGATAQLSTGLSFRNIERVRISTGGGNDRLFGGEGDDSFWTSVGNDTVIAGAGDDYLDLGWGTNLATGGVGADTFFLANDGLTTITDFSVAQGDTLFLELAGLDIPTAFGLEVGYFRFTDSAAGAVIEIDLDADRDVFGWTQVALLQGVAVAALTPDAFVI